MILNGDKMTDLFCEDSIIEAEKSFEIKALRDEIEKLKNIVTKYQILMKEAGVESDTNLISDEEVICVREISRLKELSAERELSTDEVKKLDLLHKNLKLARGESLRVNWEGQAKKMSTEELEKIANVKK